MHVDVHTRIYGFKLLALHVWNVKVKQHCILVSYTLLDKPDLVQIHNAQSIDQKYNYKHYSSLN